MALKPCRECREQVSTWATTCPKCGKQYPHASVWTAIGGLGSIALLCLLIYKIAAADRLPNAPATTASSSVATSHAEPLPPADLRSDMPPDEIALVAAVVLARQQYDAGANDMAKGAARPTRARALCATVGGSAKDWIGKVVTLSTNSDGKGVFAVEISNGIQVTTWNNDVSDVFDHTLFEPSSPLFAVATQLHTDQIVRFSGSFRRSSADCFEESSLTLAGSIAEPSFIFGFSAIAPL
jgi:hypothetical protein